MFVRYVYEELSILIENVEMVLQLRHCNWFPGWF